MYRTYIPTRRSCARCARRSCANCAPQSRPVVHGLGYHQIITKVQHTIGSTGISQDENMKAWLGRTLWALHLQKVKCIIESGGEQPDWTNQLLIPLCGEISDICKALHMLDPELEAVLYMCSVIILSCEILLQRLMVTREDGKFAEDSLTHADKAFIEDTFMGVFAFNENEDLRLDIFKALNAEAERLVNACADRPVLTAVFFLQDIMVELQDRFVEPDKVVSFDEFQAVDHERRRVAELDEVHQRFPLDDDTSSPVHVSMPDGTPGSWELVGWDSPESVDIDPPDSVDNVDDVQIRFYLKSDSSIKFQCISSAQTHNDELVIRTYTGLKIHLEDGVLVSSIQPEDDSIVVSVDTDADGGKALSGTITLPPGSMYRIDNVLPFGWSQSDVLFTGIKTAYAYFVLSCGPFSLERDGGHIVVHNML